MINCAINHINCFFLVGHIWIRDMDHQMNFKRQTNHMILSSCVTQNHTIL
jgi:hypothetical protein